MKVLELKRDYMKSARNAVSEARKAVKLVAANASLGAKLHVAVRKAGAGASVHSWAGGSGKVYVYANIAVASFKDDAALAKILSIGIEMLGGGAKFESHDYAESRYRDYIIDGSGVRLEVSASLAGEGSENCRRIKVGEEVKIVEKYEFRCD